MKIKDVQALKADLEEVCPALKLKLCELIEEEVDPLELPGAFALAQSSLFTMKPWQLTVAALSEVIGAPINHVVDTSEGGLVAFVHLTTDKVLAYHTSHETYRVLEYRHLTGINWYG